MTSDPQRSPRYRMLILLLVLAAAWLLWSGLFKPLLLGLGLLSCVITFMLVRRMGYFDDQLYALRFSFRLFGYWVWFGRQIRFRQGFPSAVRYDQPLSWGAVFHGNGCQWCWNN